ncbi:hypothetical protein Ccrd_001375, partial [Cynara cardunculus var. scolymus]
MTQGNSTKLWRPALAAITEDGVARRTPSDSYGFDYRSPKSFTVRNVAQSPEALDHHHRSSIIEQQLMSFYHLQLGTKVMVRMAFADITCVGSKAVREKFSGIISDEEEEFEDTNDDLDKDNNDEFILSDETSGSETADSPEVAFPMAIATTIQHSSLQHLHPWNHISSSSSSFESLSSMTLIIIASCSIGCDCPATTASGLDSYTIP